MGTYISNLNGAPNLPIIVRAYPGERAVIDRAAPDLFPTTLQVNGSYSWFGDLKITNSDPTRDITVIGSNPSNGRAQGVTMFNGTNNKLINLVVHDSGDGIADNDGGSNNEIYGNLIYHNGWLAPDRGHGQGIYAQNQTGYKQIYDNIIFSGFNQGIQVYGSPRASLNNFDIEGNIVFNTGMLQGSYDRGILVGGNGPCQNPIVANNYGYFNPIRPTAPEHPYKSATATPGLSTQW